MKQLKVIILSVLVAWIGFQCAGIGSCPDIDYHPYYLEIENLTGDVARIEFHEKDTFRTERGEVILGGGEFFFNLPPGEVQTVYRARGRGNELGIEDSPLPGTPFVIRAAYYDSVLIVVGERRELFWGSYCIRSDGCDPPVLNASPGWQSTWNLHVEDKWKLVEEPHDLCDMERGGSWGYRFSLRPK